MQNKYLKFLLIVLIIAFVVPQITLAAWWNPFSWGVWNRIFHSQTQQQKLIGGDKDSHGCLGGAGYSWCEAKQKCLRVWEEACVKDVGQPIIDNIVPSSGSAGTVVTLTGKNFTSGSATYVGVSESGQMAWTPSFISSTQIKFTIPEGLSAGPHKMSVFISAKQTPTSNDVIFTVVADQTSGWKTYTNTQYEFEIKVPSFYEEGKTSKSTLSGQPVADFYNKDTNLLNISVFEKPFSEYKLVDQAGGLTFYFDESKKQWLYLNGQTSNFAPKRMDAPVEAYIYRSGDVTCSWDWIIIPSSSHSYVVEMANTTCDELRSTKNGMDYKKPDFILDSKQLISTFKFIPVK